jgi:GTP cyclohydrolase II
MWNSVNDPSDQRLRELADATLPTRWGDFSLHVFRWDDPNAHPELSQQHVALVMGEVTGRRGVPVRIHSECLTGEVFGSLRCDCREQLLSAQSYIAAAGIGVLLYLRQEGRGIGLTNKIKAYALQDKGADTVDANLQLHLPVDARQYDVAGAMLRQLGVMSIRLLTNNPDKLAGIRAAGIEVEERVPNWVPANRHSASYLEVKRDRLNHEIPSDAWASAQPPGAAESGQAPPEDSTGP